MLKDLVVTILMVVEMTMSGGGGEIAEYSVFVFSILRFLTCICICDMTCICICDMTCIQSCKMSRI